VALKWDILDRRSAVSVRIMLDERQFHSHLVLTAETDMLEFYGCAAPLLARRLQPHCEAHDLPAAESWASKGQLP